MKRKQPGKPQGEVQPRPQPEPPASGPAGPIAPPDVPRRSRLRRWCFRCAAILAPLLLVLAVEGLLRWLGYGHPTAFLLAKEVGGRSVLVQNQRFGWTWFPPAIARSPEPICIPTRKPENGLRIFLFGESAALGDPEPAFGMGRQLETILRACYPEKNVEVVNVAMTAINSHVIRDIARDCAGARGDFWIVYAGNNEVVGPFGAGTIFGSQAPPVGVARATVALKSLRLGQWLGRVAGSKSAPAEWLGMEFFLKEQVPAADPRLDRVRANFAANLHAIVESGKKAGAHVLVSTVGVNLRDCPPFASRHGPALAGSRLAEWQALWVAGLNAQQDGRHTEALAAFQKAMELDPAYAQTAFRMAESELALNRAQDAAAHFLLARDLDTLRFRADSPLAQVTRAVAGKSGVRLVDVESELAQRSRAGVPGDDLFYDHVHLNFTGNYMLAGLFAREIAGQLGRATTIIPAEDEVRRRLAFGKFDERRVAGEMRRRLQQAPFSGQLNFPDRDRRWSALIDTLAPDLQKERDLYRAALDLAPADWVLWANQARFLETVEDAAAAMNSWREVTRLMPFEPDAWYHLGNLAEAAGNLSEAESFFQAAVDRSARPIEPLNALGLLKAERGATEEALRLLRGALKLDPRSSASRVNLAVVLARTGDAQAALDQLQAVLRSDTNNVPARVNLARLLAAQGKTDEAIGLYREAMRLNPEDPVASLNLGNVLFDQGRFAEAAQCYRSATEARPAFGEAHYRLGLALARLGSVAESLEPFASAARLMPRSVEARYNHGIALAKMGRLAEAAGEFEAVLKLDPNHQAARAALERASRK